MIEEKELFTGSLPFLAGAVAGRMAAQACDAFAVAQILFAAVCACIITMMAVQNRLSIFAALFFCGASLVATSSIPGAGGISPEAFAPAQMCSNRLRSLIDSMPYRSPRTNALLKALLSADRSSMTYSDRAIFKRSGASHLLALSGMHVGIIYLLLGKLLSPLGNSPAAKRAKSCISIASIGFFTLMAGAAASIVRAFLFIMLKEAASMACRPCSIGRALSDALIIQLCIMPEAIADLGFKLSYLAMAGIVFVFPRLDALYPGGKKSDPVKWIWSLAAISLSCQLMTAPVVWMNFHTFPRHFLLTNLMAAPLMTVIMFTAIACVGCFSLGICPEWLLRISELPCELLLNALETVSSL